MSNPVTPNRWSQPAPARVIEQAARTQSSAAVPSARTDLRSLAATGESVVLVVGTLDTKGEELRFIRDVIRGHGLPVRMADISTSGGHSGAEIPAHLIAAHHPRGAAAVFTRDRGQSVAGMSVAFERWMERQSGIAGVIAAGGSGGTSMAAPAFRSLAVGIPKIIISTVASGDVSRYTGSSDILMMYSVADVQGLNTITRAVLRNGAHALAGMVEARRQAALRPAATGELPAVGITMFGVTTPCVQQITEALKSDYDCLVFHATGAGGRSMEKLVDSGLIKAVIDITTTEVPDMLVGGVFPATEDRFGAIIRKRIPYIGACGALDMVNFGAFDTVPEKFRNRNLYRHNPQVTLMRTTPEECTAIGRWIGERLNQMDAPVRFFLPEGGVSALDKPGQPFHDPAADQALFRALEQTVVQTANRQLVRLPSNVNDAAFVQEVVKAFRMLQGGRVQKKPQERRA